MNSLTDEQWTLMEMFCPEVSEVVMSHESILIDGPGKVAQTDESKMHIPLRAHG